MADEQGTTNNPASNTEKGDHCFIAKIAHFTFGLSFASILALRSNSN